MSDKIDKARVKWAELAKRMTQSIMERNEKLEDLCPNQLVSPDERRPILKAICSNNRDIAKLADDMATAEAEAAVGTKVLLGHDPGNLVRMVLSLMVVGRFEPRIGHEVRFIQDIIGMVGARDPEDCLSVRALFRDDSVLQPHISICPGCTLDESPVRIREASLNKLLGQQKDESERLCDAVALTKTWK